MIEQQKQTYEFDEFRLDVMKRQLLREGEVVPLYSKAFDLLLLLFGGHLRRARTLLDLLADEFAPIDPLIDAEADGKTENRQKNDWQQPAGFPDDVFKRVFRREENAGDAAERTNRC